MTKNEKDKVTKATKILDLQGEVCPYPALYAVSSLEHMAPGETLEVLTDGLCAVEGIPGAISQSGHKLLRVELLKTGVYRFIIEVT